MVAEINVKDIKAKLIAKLQGTGWEDKLYRFLSYRDFDDIIYALHTDVSHGYRFTPTLNDVLNPFIHCPYDKVRIIFLVPEPILRLGYCDGLAFSCNKVEYKKGVEAMQQYIFDEIDRTVYKKNPPQHERSLKRWAEQGILLINCTPTTRLHEKGKHVDIWRTYSNWVVEMLNEISKDLIFVFFGDAFERWGDNLSHDKKIFTVTNPIDMGRYSYTREWNSNNLFNIINQELKRNGETEIKW